MSIGLLGCIYMLMPVWVTAQTDSGKQLPVQTTEKKGLPAIQQITTLRPALESTMVQPTTKKIKQIVKRDSVGIKEMNRL